MRGSLEWARSDRESSLESRTRSLGVESSVSRSGRRRRRALLVTRIVLADVAGHGSVVAATSLRLKRLLRRFMNTKRQVQLVSEINRAFISGEAEGRFVTAVVMTYLHHRRRLLVTNAGHPRPLFYSKSLGSWSLIESPSSNAGSENSDAVDMPFGIDDSADYSELAQPIADGDLVVLYTDALTEVTGDDDRLLGESGLLALVRRIDVRADCASIGHELRGLVRDYGGGESNDDESLIVIKFGEGRRTPRVVERLRGYWSTLCGTIRG